jgi:paraquat-inducible protein A
VAHASNEFLQCAGGRRVLACPECDLVQREPSQPVSAGTVNCVRCGATLFRCAPHALDATLAFALGAAVLFFVAVTHPIMSLALAGQVTTETLLGLSSALAVAGMPSVGALVFVTVLLMPALEIAALLWLLGPLKLGVVPPGLAFATRVLNAVRPWAMLEVLLLAGLVSIGRLEKVAQLTLGVAFWSLAAMMVLFAVIDSLLDQRDIWDRADTLNRDRADALGEAR